ncbi:Cuticle protein CPCFC [Cinara cedri]|uniref:Cuticle protein CPCFC n=1 Tax=Cinara cedri TaxID=506608 RepID=A0A5E4MY18_9HEMI|nr:Cuticle protein CPCFC [Cinara cedri]
MIRGIIAIIFAVQATALGGARYPSGLNPALCPNYPHCDNALLAAYVQTDAGTEYSDDRDQHRYNGNDGQYQHHPYQAGSASSYNNRQPLANLPYTEPGYPAGLSSSSCPNYPYCSHHVPAEAHKYGPLKRYPAGITPQNCPNYPYCY